MTYSLRGKSTPTTRRKRRPLPTKLHLPDCNILAFGRSDTADTRKCDCGKPLGILPAYRTIVRRYSPRRGKVALVVVDKSKVLEGEEDLAESRLLFEAESQAWIREQQRADERKARGRSKRRGADFSDDVWRTLNG